MNSSRFLPFAPTVLRPLAGLALGLALLLGAGCADVPNAAFEETVDFDSSPAKATVTIDGTNIGTTPTQAVLAKERETHVVIAKPGFAPKDIYVHIVDGSLAPNPVKVNLMPELLPDKPGADPSAEMATCLENLNKYVAMGSIAPEDKAYAEEQIRTFFKTPAASGK